MLIDPKYPKGQNYKVTEHTVERVRWILDQDWIAPPEGFAPVENIKTASEVFAGYLLLDALIGNTDRHHENWALLVPTHDPGGAVRRREVQLAPTFDHASSLGFNLRDPERVDRMTPGRNRSVESFADKAQSKLYLDLRAAKPLSPLEAFRQATKDLLETRHAWLDQLRRISDEQVRGIIDRIPNERISQPARDFAHALIRVNKARILGLK
jgi:hypothetical protein